MADEPTQPPLSGDDRLTAVAYQLVALYERWSEDRQVAAKQGAETAELVRLFTEQVKGFEQLEPTVRRQLVESIRQATIGVAKTVTETTTKAATQASTEITQRLDQSVQRAERVLAQYRREVVTTQWKVIGVACVMTLLTTLLFVWLFLPQPTLPLNAKQIKLLQLGQEVDHVWPALTKDEQKRLLDRLKHRLK